jgi:hypothetical protein
MVLRIKNQEIFDNIEGVLERILNFPSPGRGGIKGGVIKTFPILALTATATKKVRTDIVERL